MSLLFRRQFSRTVQFAAPSKAHKHAPIDDKHFPVGYFATGLSAGIKKNKGGGTPPEDLAIIISTTPRTSSAACFTRNAFKAAPVVVSTEVLKRSQGRANKLIVNSGCANAVTGRQGMEDAWAMVAALDDTVAHLSNSSESPEPSTLVMSTGVIGQHLPIKKILDGVGVASPQFPAKSTASPITSGFTSWEVAARGFMTTDTFPKLRAHTFTVPFPTTNDSLPVRIAGIDKGAGMIHPNMGPPHATLLGLIATDAPINPSSLQNALTFAVQRSFNSISVDGDMSTNDTVVAFANGAAISSDPSNPAEEIDEKQHPEAFKVFRDELTKFSSELAQLIVWDGEGATKFVTITVKNAHTYEQAHHIASTVSTSAILKCALYGEDANWGRILCAVGYSPLTVPVPFPLAGSQPNPLPPANIDPTSVSVSFLPSTSASSRTPLLVLKNGEPEIVDEVRAKEMLSESEIAIEIDLGLGSESATYWTCDFSHEYVTINGDYRS